MNELFARKVAFALDYSRNSRELRYLNYNEAASGRSNQITFLRLGSAGISDAHAYILSLALWFLSSPAFRWF